MKILVVSQHYAPEPFRLTDICESLVAAGHSVTVVTDVPNYPEGYIYDGYKGGKRRDEIIGGVRVRRTFTIGRREGVLFRFLNYYSWRFSAGHYLKHLKEDFDAVLAYQTSPVMMAQPALDYAKKHNKKVLLYCLDIWPACLKAGGIGESSPIYKYYHGLSKKVYSSASKILVGSALFIDYFREELGISDIPIEYLPQYAEALFDSLPEAQGKNEGVLDLVFAGNVGHAQGIKTLLDAAALTVDLPVRWHIVGDGSELASSKQGVEKMGLTNVLFHGRHPLEDMPAFYAMADAMLLTLCNDEVISFTLPGKMQTYMAAGKPVIASANGESANVMRRADCGYCTPAEHAESLADSVRRFSALSSKERDSLGRAARKYYEENFLKADFIARLTSALASLNGIMISNA